VGTVIAIAVFILGPIYGVIFWVVSRLPFWALAPMLGIAAVPYVVNWDRLMAGGLYYAALPRIILITVVGALTAALIFRVLALFRARENEDARVRLQFLVGLAGFPNSAVAVLSF
jgi:hypothetical protein